MRANQEVRPLSPVKQISLALHESAEVCSEPYASVLRLQSCLRLQQGAQPCRGGRLRLHQLVVQHSQPRCPAVTSGVMSGDFGFNASLV